jgi:hypothetical protein
MKEFYPLIVAVVIVIVFIWIYKHPIVLVYLIVDAIVAMVIGLLITDTRLFYLAVGLVILLTDFMILPLITNRSNY